MSSGSMKNTIEPGGHSRATVIDLPLYPDKRSQDF
jgi:hypothetical protein